MTFGEINTAILGGSHTEDELRRIVRSASSKLKLVVEQRGLAVAGKLRLQMKVGFGDKSIPKYSRQSYKEGKIVKMNKTRAAVDVDGVRWTVPFAMLTVV
jgi:hypothetical protein